MRSFNCIYFVPQLGFNASNGDHTYLERMTALFLRTAQNVVHSKYSIVYGHSKYSLYSQAKTLRHLYRILPRHYKKHISRIYVLHPTPKSRAFFKISKLFIEDKIAEKVTFVHSISALQALLSPLALRLPPALLRLEDARLPTAALPDMPSLVDLFVRDP